MNVFCSAAAHLAFDREGRETSEDQDRRAPAGSIVYGGTKALGSDIDVHDDALRFAGRSRVAIGHREGNHLSMSASEYLHAFCIAYLVRTGDNLGELSFLFILTFDDGFNDGGVVTAKVDKDVGYAILPQRFEEREGCSITIACQISFYFMRWELKPTPY